MPRRILLLPALLAALLLCSCGAAAAPAETAPPEAAAAPEETPAPAPPPEPEKPGLALEAPRVERVDAETLSVSWADARDAAVAEYRLLRRDMTDPEAAWETLASLRPGEDHAYTDRLPDGTPRQYAYRLDFDPAEGAELTPLPGEAALGSNLLICLDPGHFDGASVLSGDLLYGYTEAGFVLRLGLLLREDLKARCGIECRMTRTGGSITLEGLTDGALDNGRISLRGQYAEGCDLFLSLHTNGNAEGANGCATCSQPRALDRPMLIANGLARENDTVLRLCNAVGRNLAAASFERGIGPENAYVSADRDGIVDWTQEYNDSPASPGTVVRRMGGALEYYGVLYGSQAVGVPGVIIEHGFHTVPSMRRAAMEGDLCEAWALADAAGIAEGYGFFFLEL